MNSYLYGKAAIWVAVCHGFRLLAIESDVNSPTNSGVHHLWRPVTDSQYLQEVGTKILTQQPVTAVTVSGTVLYLVEGGILKKLKGQVVEDAAGAPQGIRRMKSLAGALWVANDQATYRLYSNSWQQVASQPFRDFCVHLGEVYGATRDDIFRFESNRFVNCRPSSGYLSSDETVLTEDFQQVLVEPVEIGPIDRLASYSGTLYLLRPGSLALMEGKSLVLNPIDWGMLPSPVTRDLLAQGSRLYVATDRGLAV